MLDAFIEYFKDQCIYEPNGGVPVRRRVSVTRTLTGDGDQCFQKTQLLAVFFTRFMFFTRFYFLHGTIFLWKKL